MTTVDDERIDELVRSVAPTVPVLSQQALRELAGEVIGDVARHPASAPTTTTPPATRPAGSQAARAAVRGSRPRGWRRRAVLVPVAAGVGLVLAAAGFARLYDTSTADFEQAVQRYSAELPLPPGTDRTAYVELLQAQGLERPSQISELGVTSMVSYYGSCTWLAAWQVRAEAGDAPGAEQALEAYRRAIAAPALRATDGGGVVSNLERVADAAATGDGDRVQQELDNNCTASTLEGIR